MTNCWHRKKNGRPPMLHRAIHSRPSGRSGMDYLPIELPRDGTANAESLCGGCKWTIQPMLQPLTRA